MARRAFLHGVAKVLAWYPPLRDFAPEWGSAAVLELAASLELYHGYEIAWWAAKSAWVCLCGRRAGPLAKRQLAKTSCDWVVSRAAALLHSARTGGHLPQLAFPCKGPRVLLVLCVRCGCYAERNPVGLAEPCVVGSRRRGTFTKGNAYRRGLFVRGLHPQTRAAMEDPFSRIPAADRGLLLLVSHRRALVFRYMSQKKSSPGPPRPPKSRIFPLTLAPSPG